MLWSYCVSCDCPIDHDIVVFVISNIRWKLEGTWSNTSHPRVLLVLLQAYKRPNVRGEIERLGVMEDFAKAQVMRAIPLWTFRSLVLLLPSCSSVVSGWALVLLATCQRSAACTSKNRSRLRPSRVPRLDLPQYPFTFPDRNP